MRICLTERPTHNFIFALQTAGGQVYTFSDVTAGGEKSLHIFAGYGDNKGDARNSVMKSPEALNNGKTTVVMEPTSSVTVSLMLQACAQM